MISRATTDSVPTADRLVVFIAGRTTKWASSPSKRSHRGRRSARMMSLGKRGLNWRRGLALLAIHVVAFEASFTSRSRFRYALGAKLGLDQTPRGALASREQQQNGNPEIYAAIHVTSFFTMGEIIIHGAMSGVATPAIVRTYDDAGSRASFMNLSRSVSCSISSVWPACFNKISLRCFLVRMNSSRESESPSWSLGARQRLMDHHATVGQRVSLPSRRHRAGPPPCWHTGRCNKWPRRR